MNWLNTQFGDSTACSIILGGCMTFWGVIQPEVHLVALNQNAQPAELSVRNWGAQQVESSKRLKAWLTLPPELCLLSPSLPPSPGASMGKLSSTKPVPHAKKFGDCYSKQTLVDICAPPSWGLEWGLLNPFSMASLVVAEATFYFFCWGRLRLPYWRQIPGFGIRVHTLLANKKPEGRLVS